MLAGLAVHLDCFWLCIEISTRWQCNQGYKCCATVQYKVEKNKNTKSQSFSAEAAELVSYSVNNMLLLSLFNQQGSTKNSQGAMQQVSLK